MNSERYLSRCPRQAKSRGASVIAFSRAPAKTPMAPTRHFGGSSVCERLYCAPPARLPTLFLGFGRFQGVRRQKTLKRHLLSRKEKHKRNTFTPGNPTPRSQ